MKNIVEGGCYHMHPRLDLKPPQKEPPKKPASKRNIIVLGLFFAALYGAYYLPLRFR